MRWFWTLLVAMGLVGCAVGDAPAPRTAGPPPWQADTATQLMVMLPALDREALTRTTEALLRDHEVTLVAQWPLDEVDLHCLVFIVPDAARRDETVARLQQDPRVQLAQPMNEFLLESSGPGDPFADLQRGLLDAGVQPVHALATGRGIRIAIVDSALEEDHPDLASRIVTRRDVVGGGGNVEGEPHGTAVGGVIGAARGNSEGIIGVAPEAEIIALRACWEEADEPVGRCSSFTLARALNLALSEQPRVLNLSLSGPSDPVLTDLLNEAHARGIVIVGAANPQAERVFPSEHPAVIAVANADEPASVDRAALSAPGSRILTTLPDASYGFRSGTSIATAHVTGVVALLLELKPSLAPGAIRDVLQAHGMLGGAVPAVDACRSAAEIVASRPDLALACGASADEPA